MTKPPARKMGRPRCFQAETALEAAMRLFWERGYEGASLREVTDAMAMNRASLYATFGDREAHFLKVLERYEDGPALYLKIKSLFTGLVNLLGDPRNPRGDLITQGALATGVGAANVKQALIDRRKSGEAELLKRFKRARSEGDLSQTTNVQDLAGFVCTVLYGFRVLAVNGNSKADLKRVADVAYKMLPI